MKHQTIRACSIWRALEIVGDVTTMLILEQAFLGRRRFQDFVNETGIARSVVSQRLERLVESGVLEKSAERRGGYRLSVKGKGLFPVALMILRWQHLWERDERGLKVQLVHRDCRTATEPVPACSHCAAVIDPREVSWAPGPGLSQVMPIYARRRMQTASASAKRGTRLMVDAVIELFGDRWATLIVRACFTGIHRFDEIQRDAGMASNILSDRLERLLAQGIIKAVPYSAHQDRFEYRLTDKGRDLYPVLLGLLQWGDVWYADNKGPPLLLHHNACNYPLTMRPACSACGETITTENSSFIV